MQQFESEEPTKAVSQWRNYFFEYQKHYKLEITQRGNFNITICMQSLLTSDSYQKDSLQLHDRFLIIQCFQLQIYETGNFMNMSNIHIQLYLSSHINLTDSTFSIQNKEIKIMLKGSKSDEQNFPYPRKVSESNLCYLQHLQDFVQHMFSLRTEEQGWSMTAIFV